MTYELYDCLSDFTIFTGTEYECTELKKLKGENNGYLVRQKEVKAVEKPVIIVQENKPKNGFLF